MPSFIDERSVLKPKDPALKDSNEWELFTLTNAEVRHAETGELCSLLMADAVQPVVVTGNLEQLARRQNKLLLRPEYSKSTPLRIDNVMLFSYGEDPDPEDADDPSAIQIWAAGGAGWFKVKPGRAYKEFHKDIQEAVSLLWFAADVYGAVKKGPGPSADMFFKEYVEDEETACTTLEEARKLFYKHRHFLMLAMINGKEGISWARAPLKLHLKEHFPIDYQAMMDKAHLKTPSTQTADHVATPKAGGTSTVQTTKPKATVSKNRGRPKRDDNYFRARVVWEVMQKVEAQSLLRPEDISVSRLAKAMTERYEIEDEEVAANFIKAHADNVRHMMQKKTLQKRPTGDFRWDRIPLYKELQTSSDLPAATVRKVAEVELKPRKVPPPPSLSDTDQTASDARSRRAGKGAARPKKGRLSVLRPKSSGNSSRATTARGKAPPTMDLPDSSSDEDRSGAEPMDLGSSGKRKSQDPESLPPAKRNTSRRLPIPATPLNAASDDDDDNSSIASSEIDASDLSSPANITGEIPLPWAAQPDTSTATANFITRIVSTPLPSYEPNAPGNVWVCTVDGCAHRVYAATSDPSRALIKEHYDRHNANQQAQLDLLVSEEQRTRLPVNNLFKRIRDAAAQQGANPALVAALDGYPAPIVRKT